MAEFFIRRPIVAMVISIFIIILGFLSLGSLPISQYPEITPPMVQVTTTFTGANSINVEEAVASKIEQEVNGVENMIYMKSTNSSDGNLRLDVSFEVEVDLDIANMLTVNRVNQALPFMPQDVKNFGVSTKKSLSFPLLVVSLYSPEDTYDDVFLSNFSKINLVDAMARVEGVGKVDVLSGSDYAMRMWVKPDMISKMGITVPEIMSAIRAQNVITPGGKFGAAPSEPGTQFTYTVLLKERLKSEAEFGEILIRTNEDGGEVKLKDVARIELGQESYRSLGRLNSKPGAIMAIYQMPGSNALNVAEQIKQLLADQKKYFPDDVEYELSLDTTEAVTAGIDEIVETLFIAIFLVILVVFIFLQNWRATLIPLFTIPVSLIGCFIIFPMIGFSINVLSLLGLVLAIGIVVDDAIVVVEATMLNIEKGMTPKEATSAAMKEVTGPIIATTLIIVAVFVPVAGIAGITGRLYQQFAITITISVLFSSLNALSLSPAMASLLLRPPKKTKGILGKFFDLFNNILDKTTSKYLGTARFFARKVFRALILIIALVAGVIFLGGRIPTGFVPEEDQGYILLDVKLPDAASLERTDEICKKAEAILAKNSFIQAYNVVPGYSLLSGSFATNTGVFFVTLKPWDERGVEGGHFTEIIKTLNGQFMMQIPEAQVFAFGPPPIQGIGNASGFTMMLQDRTGQTPFYLAEQTNKFLQAASARPEIDRIYTTFRSDVPQIRIDIDRNKAIRMDLKLDDVNQTLGAFLGGSYINDFNRFGRQYKTFIQAEAEYRSDPKSLNQFFVKSKKDEMVPLSAIAEVSRTSGPEFTNRFNMYRSAEVSGVPAKGFSSAQALDALEEVAREVLPPTMSYAWANMSYQERASAGTAGQAFMLALIFVFLILAAQYESWTLPMSVLMGTPFAIFGAMLGLFIARMFSESFVNNVFAQIGFVMLIGMGAKNAILIVEFAKIQKERGMAVYDAAIESARLRFRPILMTAFSFILGVMPLLLATGAGAEARVVMGMTMFSGMLIATILGVMLIPAGFVMIENMGKKKKKKQIASDEPTQAELQNGEEA